MNRKNWNKAVRAWTLSTRLAQRPGCVGLANLIDRIGNLEWAWATE